MLRAIRVAAPWIEFSSSTRESVVTLIPHRRINSRGRPVIQHSKKSNPVTTKDSSRTEGDHVIASQSILTRRTFIQAGTAAAAAFSIIPRQAFSAAGVAPSEKLTVAYIGCGTQGTRELLRLLALPDVQVVAV